MLSGSLRAGIKGTWSPAEYSFLEEGFLKIDFSTEPPTICYWGFGEKDTVYLHSNAKARLTFFGPERKMMEGSREMLEGHITMLDLRL